MPVKIVDKIMKRDAATLKAKADKIDFGSMIFVSRGKE